MSANDPRLQIEVTIDPGKDRRVGPRRPATTPASDPPTIPRVTRLMALAIKFQDMVDRGEVRDYADLARLGLVTRARLRSRVQGSAQAAASSSCHPSSLRRRPRAEPEREPSRRSR